VESGCVLTGSSGTKSLEVRANVLESFRVP
jgi:hypothetical protein